nr:hypothetical protein [Streptomyces albidoflavus]
MGAQHAAGLVLAGTGLPALAAGDPGFLTTPGRAIRVEPGTVRCPEPRPPRGTPVG